MKKWKRYLISPIIFLCLIVWIEFSLNTPELLKMTEDVKAEFNNIKQMPGAQMSDYKATRKTNNAYVGANFTVEASYEDIKRYYLNELKQKGWEFEGESIVKAWDKDVGNKDLRFMKGTYELVLFYCGEDLSYQFGIDISWRKD